MQPGAAERVFELLSIEIMHDIFLGPLEDVVCLTLFYFTRDTKHPNYFGLTTLNQRMQDYPWHSVAKSDKPEQFSPFPSKLKHSGTAVYGEGYGGWMIPNTDHGLKWTAAVAINFAVHMVALLSPLIKDQSCPMWRHWVMYHEICCWSLKWTCMASEIVAFDSFIREEHELFLSIPQFQPFYKPKFHNCLKAARNWLYNGPLRVTWAMKCEKYLRTMKGYGSKSNFKNVALTMTTRYARDRGHFWITGEELQVTYGVSHQHDEYITKQHPFYAKLALVSPVVMISWYQVLSHQGVQYTPGKVCLHTYDEGQSMLLMVQGVLHCMEGWQLVGYQFKKHDDGRVLDVGGQGLLMVDACLMDTNQLVLLSVEVDSSIVSFYGIRHDHRIILVEDV
jgi:hypothetical protein